VASFTIALIYRREKMRGKYSPEDSSQKVLKLFLSAAAPTLLQLNPVYEVITFLLHLGREY
jgi:hypothetical protein